MRMRISIENGRKCIKQDTVASPRVPGEGIFPTWAARAFAIAARRSRIPRRRMAPECWLLRRNVVGDVSMHIFDQWIRLDWQNTSGGVGLG